MLFLSEVGCASLTVPVMLAVFMAAISLPGAYRKVAPNAVPLVRSVTAEDRCLGDAIYHEARGEDFRGQTLVAEVVLNRTEHPDFPKTVCGVTRQPGAFRWSGRRVGDGAAYRKAVVIAVTMRAGLIGRRHRNLLWFHNPKTAESRRLSEPWRRNTLLVLGHGKHAFFMDGRARALKAAKPIVFPSRWPGGGGIGW